MGQALIFYYLELVCNLLSVSTRSSTTESIALHHFATPFNIATNCFSSSASAAFDYSKSNLLCMHIGSHSHTQRNQDIDTQTGKLVYWLCTAGMRSIRYAFNLSSPLSISAVTAIRSTLISFHQVFCLFPTVTNVDL